MKKIFTLLLLVCSHLTFSQNFQLDLRAYLEGPFFTNDMTPWINWSGNLPLSQPYDTIPWYYYGDEDVSAIPNNQIVDWILVELRKSTGPAETATMDSVIVRKVGFLLRDGVITDIDGVSNLQFNVTITSNLYVVIRHRNHISIMSANALVLNSGIYSYDFSFDASQVLGSSLSYKELAPGIWGEIAGDGNGDGQVNQADKIDVWSQEAGLSGFYAGDFDMNSQVDNTDKVEMWIPNGGTGSQVPGWEAANTPPYAVITANPATGSTNTIFDLNASLSYDNESVGSLLAVRWDFEGDGTWDTPWSYNQTNNYNYSLPGSYNLKLEVMDPGGLINTTAVTMDVVVGVGCEGVDSVVYEGKTYHTVEIGKQCWFKENLDIGAMIDGTVNMSDDTIIEKYCYDNDPSNCDTYGGLYQWDEIMNWDTIPGQQGICPDGWHVPTDDEWKVLEGNADSRYGVGDTIWEGLLWRGFDAGGNLKEIGTVHWNAPNFNAKNSSGFTALPGGHRYVNGSFHNIGNSSTIWSSNPNGPNTWYRDLNFVTAEVYRSSPQKESGFSARCLRDYINIPPSEPENPQPADGSVEVDIPNLSWSCSDPNGDIIRYSIYFGTTTNPPLIASNQAYMNHELSSLLELTTYFWRIVATDMHGDSISGAEWNFTTGAFICGTDVIDSRTFSNGEVYPTIVIGNQCWMKKNLNYGVFTPGTNSQTNTGYPERYCYDDIPANCDTYGGLYQWDEMMDYSSAPGVQGICPDGWHIPEDNEWKILEGTVDSVHLIGDPVWDWGINSWRGFDAGSNLKEAGTVHWYSPNAGATNSSGFTGMPGGYRDKTGPFGALTIYNGLWSSDVIDTVVWTRTLHYNHTNIRRIIGNKSYGISVRCLRDQQVNNLPPDLPSNPLPENGSININTNTLLSWSCSDPEGDYILYDIYLETDSIPVLVKANHPDTIYKPAVLIYNTNYIWKVVAHDPHGNYTAGPLWSFKTGGEWSCGEPLFDTRDGQTYTTAQIGNQCWM
ncbi:MAG: hypothetical protein K8R53_05690, partial [Bacteroidales bacterium]|nr:hypothetical protein [Bacteroidales bacterium]